MNDDGTDSADAAAPVYAAGDVRRRRAAWRAAHRGTKELDVLIGRFAEARLGSMTEVELDQFEVFLALPDPDLQAWLLAPTGPPAAEHADLVAAVRAFHGLA